MRKKKIKILHVAQAAGGVDRYIRMLLKYLDKEKFENILVCSQDFNREDYDGLVDSFEQIEMNRAIGVSDLNSIKEVRRLIKKYNPDIVYAHSSKAGAIARVADIGLKNHCVCKKNGWIYVGKPQNSKTYSKGLVCIDPSWFKMAATLFDLEISIPTASIDIPSFVSIYGYPAFPKYAHIQS